MGQSIVNLGLTILSTLTVDKIVDNSHTTSLNDRFITML